MKKFLAILGFVLLTFVCPAKAQVGSQLSPTPCAYMNCAVSSLNVIGAGTTAPCAANVGLVCDTPNAALQMADTSSLIGYQKSVSILMPSVSGANSVVGFGSETIATLSGNGSNVNSGQQDIVGAGNALNLGIGSGVQISGTVQGLTGDQTGIYINNAAGGTTFAGITGFKVHLENNTLATVTLATAFAPVLTTNFGLITNSRDFSCPDYSAISGITTKWCLFNSDSGKRIETNGRIISTMTQIANTAALDLNGGILTGGTGTTNFPYSFIRPGSPTAVTTWSTAGTATGYNMPSGFTGNIVDAHINGGTSVYKVDYTGMVTAAGQIVAPNMTQTSSAQSGTVCWAAAGLTYDATLGCLSSLEELKNIQGDIAGASALAEVMALKPFWFRWKSTTPEWKGGDHATQPGLGAHATEKVDGRLVGYGPDGKLRGVRYQEITAVLVAAIQQQQVEISTLRAANDNLLRRVAKLERRR